MNEPKPLRRESQKEHKQKSFFNHIGVGIRDAITAIGQGIGLIFLVLAFIMLYRGCNNAETLLPPLGF
jgi:hypothetical protein